MKKKLLFTAYSMELGGIETALVNLLKRLDYDKYDVTLILEHKRGLFLQDIPSSVNILEYNISTNKIVLFRKIYNRIKLIKWKLKLKNKYDFSCSFATYSIPGAHLALAASKNSTLWMHLNFYILYKDYMKTFLDSIMTKNFKRIVFVSKENMDDVVEHYRGIKKKSVVLNNFIDGDNILKLAQEPIDIDFKREKVLINVGRHDEHQKKLTRIIEAANKLVSEGYKFKLLLIGDGKDNQSYRDLVSKYSLEETIKFCGKKKNPFPYYSLANAVILSSDYEGYPVVFLESMIMGKPILSTKVSDYEDLDGIYGIFSECNEEAVYKMMKDYLDKGFKLKDKFDYKKYNKDIMKKLEDFINN